MSGEQLLEMQGTLKLAYPTLADLGCLLTHLDENGCRGSVMFQYLPHDVVATWQRCLTPGRPVRIKIESHPKLGNVEIDGLVNQVTQHSAHSEIDLRFSNATPAQRQLLHQVLGGSGPPQSALPVTPGIADTHTALPAVPALDPQPPAAAQPLHAPVEPQPSPVIAAPSIPHHAHGGGGMTRRFEDTEAIRMRRPPPAQAAPQPNIMPVPAGVVIPAMEGAISDMLSVVPPAHRPSAPSSSPSAPPPKNPGPSASPPKSPGTLVLPALPGQDKKRIGQMLVQMGYLTEAQIDDAVKQSRIKGQRLGRYLVSSGLISPDVLCRALARQSGLPVTDLADVEINEELEKIFPFAMLMRHSFIPFDDSAMFVCIAVATPLTQTTHKELERTCHKKVEVFLAREDAILKHLNEFRKRQQGSQPRRFLRYDHRAPISYQFCSRFAGPSEETLYRGQTQNVSEGGLLVVGPGSKLGKPDEIMRRGICLRITVHNEAAPQSEIHALCRFKAIQEKNALWWMGLELLEISTEDRRHLKEVCVKAMIEQMKHKK